MAVEKKRIQSMPDLGDVPFTAIESALDGALERKGDRRRITEEVEEHANDIITGPGKRIRVVLPYLMAKGAGVDLDDEQLATAFTPIEITHGWSLIVDDANDDDDLRRGMESLQRYLVDHELVDDIDDAKSIATVEGIQVGTFAEDLIDSMEDNGVISADQRRDMARGMRSSIRRLSRGQILDIAGEQISRDRDRAEDVLAYEGEEFSYTEYELDVIEGKTAPLFELGAEYVEILAGEDLGLREYGRNLGIAFQVRDDVIDIAAEGEIGKDQYSDIEEGTMNLPIHYAFEELREESVDSVADWLVMEDYVDDFVQRDDNYLSEFSDIHEVYGSRLSMLEGVMADENPEDYELELAGEVIKSTNALERATGDAMGYAQEAVNALHDAGLEEQYETALENTAWFAASRSK